MNLAFAFLNFSTDRACFIVLNLYINCGEHFPPDRFPYTINKLKPGQGNAADIFSHSFRQ